MTKSHKNDIVVRTQEQERVQRFLLSEQGGSLLLGGDRGSGKTTLVRASVQAAEQERLDRMSPFSRVLSRLRRLTKSPYIFISIPLIVIDVSAVEGTEPDQSRLNDSYRSLLMRAMLMGMEADLLRRYYSWLDLPQRWFRSIGYFQRITSLRSYSHYTKQTKTVTRALAVPASLMNSPALQDALSAEVDLSDSGLEMKLRDLLTQYSKLHRFVFVFDELDKLPASIKLESLVLHLKNLFAETGVHAIFITDELALRRVMNQALAIPPSELTTLFVDHVLLNNMSRDEFEETVLKKVVNLPADKAGELIAALSLRTRRSPYELSKFLIRNGAEYSNLIAQLKSELGKKRFENLSVMQRLTDSVVEIYTNEHNDPYYRRILQTALEEVGTIIVGGSSKYVDQEVPSTIFYTTESFNEEGLTPEAVFERELEFKHSRKNSPAERPQIVDTISNLPEDQSVSVKLAIGTFLTLLDRSYILLLKKTEHHDVLEIGRLVESNLSHERVNQIDMDKVFDLSKDEDAVLSKIEIFDRPYLGVSKKHIYGQNKIVHRTVLNELVADSKYSLSNCRAEWGELKTVAKDTDRKLSRMLLGKVNEFVTPGVGKYTATRNVSFITTANGRKFMFVTLIGNQRFRQLPGYEKIFVVRDVSARSKMNKPTPEVKNFKMNNVNWTNFESVAKHIGEWMAVVQNS
ncbi:MAG: hypothetical protein JWN12_60 [Candidatus Saccharibacteria bacterium]|nr:hypothetical protein [Candidatus Saccharibacteria bacterium]